MSRSLLSILVTVALLFSACKPDPASTNGGGDGTGGNGGGGTGGPPAFGYTLNGNVFNRNDHPLETMASATAGYFGTKHTIDINLDFTPTSGARPKTQSLSLYTPCTLAPATYVFNDSDITASIISDSLSYKAFKGGILTITKFDTVNNLISGTFHFIAYLWYPFLDSTAQDTVVGGSFTDVAIYEGGWGQGTVSADADGFHLSSKGKSDGNSNGDNAAAFTGKKYGVFSIQGTSNDGAAGNREVYLTLISPGVGTFSLAGTVGPDHIPGATYQQWDEHTGGGINMTATSGTLTITKFDAATRRMSGTFFFSGPVSPNNDTIHITNGVIGNVQWSVF